MQTTEDSKSDNCKISSLEICYLISLLWNNRAFYVGDVTTVFILCTSSWLITGLKSDKARCNYSVVPSGVVCLLKLATERKKNKIKTSVPLRTVPER